MEWEEIFKDFEDDINVKIDGKLTILFQGICNLFMLKKLFNDEEIKYILKYYKTMCKLLEFPEEQIATKIENIEKSLIVIDELNKLRK